MRKLGVVIMLIGALFIGGSIYIKKEVAKGQEQVDSAHRKVKKSDKVFSVVPGSKKLTKSAKRKISAGQEDIDKYKKVASWLLVSGLILGAASLGALIIHSRK